jgi:hypothetical protein
MYHTSPDQTLTDLNFDNPDLHSLDLILVPARYMMQLMIRQTNGEHSLLKTEDIGLLSELRALKPRMNAVIVLPKHHNVRPGRCHNSTN